MRNGVTRHWHVQNTNGAGKLNIVDRFGHRISTERPDVIDDVENAYLMASGPEMLDVAQRALTALEDLRGRAARQQRNVDPDLVEDLRAVIEKATQGRCRQTDDYGPGRCAGCRQVRHPAVAAAT